MPSGSPIYVWIVACFLCGSSAWAGPVTRLCGQVLPASSQAFVGIVLDEGVRDALSRAGLPAFTKVLEDGRFELHVPTTLRAIRLVVGASGFATQRTNIVALETERKCITMPVLMRGASVSGRVTDEDGRPLADVRIKAIENVQGMDALPDAVKPAAKTKSTGQFTVSGLQPGDLDLHFESTGHVPRLIKGIRSPEQRELGDVKLSRANYVIGYVRDQSQEPVASAVITAAWASGSAAQTTSAKDGSFKLGPFPLGTRMTLNIKAEGYVPARSDDIVAPNDQVMMILDRNGLLRGRVIDARDGKPIESFNVRFARRATVPILTAAYPGTRAFTADDGLFEWHDVQSGVWSLAVDAPDYQIKHITGIRIPAGGATEIIDVRLESGTSVKGSVVDESTGYPIANAEVGEIVFTGRMPAAVVTRGQRTRSDGSFELTGLPREKVTLRVSASGYLLEERQVAPAADLVTDFRLSKGTYVAGTIVASDGLTPVQAIVRLDNLVSATGTSVPSDAEGRFEFRMVRSGNYKLSAESSSGVTRPRALSIGANERIEALRLQLEKGAAIRGKIQGLLPGEQYGTRVEISSSAHIRSEAVAEDGTYSLKGLSPGPVDMSVNTTTGRSLSRSVQLPHDRESIVNFEFPKGFRLSGVVTRGGAPARFVEVVAAPMLDEFVQGAAETNASGQYAIHGLNAGRYQVGVRGASASQVELQGDMVLNFDLPSLTASGLIVDASSGIPIESVTVMLQAPGELPPIRSTSNHLGRFSLPGASAGEYQLTAYKQDYERSSMPLSLSASVSDLEVPMHPSAGISVRITDARNGRALRNVTISDTGIDAPPGRIELQLSEDGVGALPRSLAGRTLKVFALGYEQKVIPSWNGTALELQLTADLR